jgi:hypothetical protein
MAEGHVARVEDRPAQSALQRAAARSEQQRAAHRTSTHRLELRQDATVDTPRIDVLIGESVSLAVDKKTVYVKDNQGKEHKLTLRKVTPLER